MMRKVKPNPQFGREAMSTRLLIPTISILLVSVLAGCTGKESVDTCAGVARPTLEAGSEGHTVVALATSKGCIVAELYDDKAPITTANFKTYVGENFYQHLTFHRIIKGFMIQTGGMQENGQFKEGTHPAITNEAASSGLKNLRYTLSMARQNAPNSATNQFFINTVDNTGLDPGGQGPGSAGYAVFGIAIEGREVADAIESTPVMRCSSGENSCPTENVWLESVKVL